MSLKLPTMKELMGEGPYPFAVQYVFDRLQKRGLFAPWLPLNKRGEVDAAKARKLFESWFTQGHLQRMAQPKQEGRPIHSAVRSMGGAYFFGGESTRVDEGAWPFPPGVMEGELTVRAGARLGGPFILCDGTVGSSHLSRLVAFPGVDCASNVTAGDSVLGPNCTIEAGVSLRSKIGRRSKRGTIVITDFRNPEQPDIDTGRKMLGIICGRDCIIEATVEPGCIFLPGCHVRSWMVGLEGGIYSPELLNLWHEEHRATERAAKSRHAAAIQNRASSRI